MTGSTEAPGKATRNMSRILAYIDDSPDDLFLFRSACKLAGIEWEPLLIEGGSEAIGYLDRRGKYSDRAKFPDAQMVLLDVKMPGIDGFDVLRHLRSNPSHANRPVGLLTSSNLPVDIENARALGATWYFLKPPDMHHLIEFVKLIDECLCDPKTCEDGAIRLSKLN